jgi:hypothetical protein
VPVGLVEVDSARDPQDLLHAEVLGEVPLDLLPGEVGVPVRVQQALRRRQRGALAVDIERAALHHQRRLVAVDSLQLRDLLAEEVVVAPREEQSAAQAAPRVESPVHGAKTPGAVDDERRPAVTHPGIVRRGLDDAHVRRQPGTRVAPLPAGGDHGHGLARGDRLGQPHPRGLRGLAPVAPGVGAFGPDQVAPVVPLPLGRHAVTVATGRARKNAGHGCSLQRSGVGQAR